MEIARVKWCTGDYAVTEVQKRRSDGQRFDIKMNFYSAILPRR